MQDHLYTSASTASTLISQLEDAGYVTRTRSEDDNRVVNVQLTTSGRGDRAEHALRRDRAAAPPPR